MGWIISPITNAILRLVWTIIIQGPLQLIQSFHKVFKYLTAGVFFDALFGGNKFDINKLPFVFWVFLMVAAFIVILIFVIQFFTLMYQEDSTISKRLLKASSNTARASLWTVIMPIAFFIGIDLIDFAQQVIYRAFGGEANTLAKMLYYVGDTNLKPTDALPAPPDNFTAPAGNDIRHWNWIAQIVGVYVTAWALCLAGLACAGKVFEMYTLFIIGPLFGASMVADDGVKLKIWRDSVIAKMFVSVGTILTYSVYVTLLPMLFKYTNSSNNDFNTLERILLQVLFLIGGGVFLETMPPFFANFVGEAAGKAEGKHALGVAQAGRSLARAAIIGGAAAIGIEKAGRARQAAKRGGFANAAANAGERKKMFGAPGLVGKGIRLGSSLVYGVSAAGLAVGLRGKGRAKIQWKANMERVRKHGEDLKHNLNHGKRHQKEGQKNAVRRYKEFLENRDLVQIERNAKLKKEILARTINKNWKKKKSGSFKNKTKNDWTK